jgi:glycosyltransferase involved in cell wall biosynthesis
LLGPRLGLVNDPTEGRALDKTSSSPAYAPKNLPSKWSKYFISRISFNEATLRDKILAPFRILYSFEAKRQFEKLIKDFKPDIVHCHNIYHQISPSILPVAKKYKIPVVMHLHDYKLICPNYQMFAHGKMCEDCAAPNYYRCLLRKCFQDSYIKSFVVTLEMYLHHKILKIYEKNIDLYIAPSKFMKDMCVKHGVPENKIKVMYNFVDNFSQDYVEPAGDYVLYLGRLSPEKGIPVLIRAMAQVKDLSLYIAGEGNEKENCEKEISQLGLEENIKLLGHLSGEKLQQTIAEAKAIVIPSVWFENMPFSMLEALALGKVVIASRIGGMPEIITEGQNGFLFSAGDSDELASLINKLRTSDLKKISEAARASVENLTIGKHCAELMSVYKKLCH